ALAYEWFERLWFPIGVHLVWNLASGPILGYGVSGYASATTLFVTSGSGRSWLTGGAFGLEGSIWIAMVELIGVAALLWRRKPRPVQSRAVKSRHPEALEGSARQADGSVRRASPAQDDIPEE